MKPHKTDKSGLGKPLIISMILHVVLIGGLLLGSDFSALKPKPVGTMVEAVVIDPNLVHQQAQRIREQRDKAARQEQERIDKLRRESELLEKNRKEEEERIRKLKEQQAKEAKAAREAEKQRAEKEQQRIQAEAQAKKAEAERKAKQAALEKAESERKARELAAQKAEAAAQAAAAKAKAEKAAAEKAEQERLAKEKAAKEAAEAARKEKQRLEKLKQERLAKEKREQDAALNNIFSDLESEAQANNSARAKFVTSELDRFGAIYKQLISDQLLTDDSFSGKSCKVNLRLIPAGSSAVLGKVSVLGGDSAVCDATVAAVAKVASYPLPTDPDIVDQLKNINLTVEPN